MSYTRDRNAHLRGVGVIASATPQTVARARANRARMVARMQNNDRMKVQLATGRVRHPGMTALGYIPPKDLDGGSGDAGVGGRGGGGGGTGIRSPLNPLRSSLAARAPGYTLTAGQAGGGYRIGGGIPVPTSIYNSPGSTNPGGQTDGGIPSGAINSGGSGGTSPTGPDGMPDQTAPAPDQGIVGSLSSMSTGTKVALGVGALAVLYAIFGGHH